MPLNLASSVVPLEKGSTSLPLKSALPVLSFDLMSTWCRLLFSASWMLYDYGILLWSLVMPPNLSWDLVLPVLPLDIVSSFRCRVLNMTALGYSA